MAKFKTSDNKLENVRRWRRTYRGLITNLYSKILERSRKNDRSNATFSLQEFREWIDTTNALKLFKVWESAGFPKDLRPSVDRKDVLRGYEFDNMQVITAKENIQKGYTEKLALWGKPICQMTLEGTVIAKYPNIETACQITGVKRDNVSAVLHGKRNKTGGFRWKFQLQPDRSAEPSNYRIGRSDVRQRQRTWRG